MPGPDITPVPPGPPAATSPQAKPPLLKSHRFTHRPDYGRMALVLQGGGALGAYQAGVFEALNEAQCQPDWVAGMSIGAINGALIAGNPPERRVERLRAFWEAVTVEPTGVGLLGGLMPAVGMADATRWFLNHLSAFNAVTGGVADFYTPRPWPPWLMPPGDAAATSFYDTAPLRQTLERLVDFDRINAAIRSRLPDTPRLSVGAVNVRTGNFTYFDSATHTLDPRHIMASAALPPGFPAVDVDGDLYWDGGLVSNTPLAWVLADEAGPPGAASPGDATPGTLIFQVDLWPARGEAPRDLAGVITRQKEIQFSSRTRMVTDELRRVQHLRRQLAAALAALPPELRDQPQFAQMRRDAECRDLQIVHLIYHRKQVDGSVKDVDFSRRTMEEHWRAGYQDTVRTLRHPEAAMRAEGGAAASVRTFDLAVDGRE